MAGETQRVVFVSSSVGRGGGAERSLFHLIKAVGAAGFQSRLITPADGIVPARLASEGIPCEVEYWSTMPPQLRTREGALPRRIGSIVANSHRAGLAGLRLGREARRKRVDLIHCNNLMPNMLGAIAGIVGNVPVIWHARDIHTRLPRRFADRLLASHPSVRRIVCVSQATARQYLQTAPRKLRVVYNGIDPAEWARSAVRPALRDEIPELRDRFIVGCHGRFVPWKGYELVITAIRELADRFPEIALVLVGDVSPGIPHERKYKQGLERLINRLGLQKHVYMVGYRSDVRPYLADFDVYVAPSVGPDPFPRSVLEAMCLGLPIVGSRSGGIPEALGPNAVTAGLLFPVADGAALTRALARLRQSPGLRQQLGEAALQAVREHFTLERYCRNMVNVFREVLSSPGAGRARRAEQADR